MLSEIGITVHAIAIQNQQVSLLPGLNSYLNGHQMLTLLLRSVVCLDASKAIVSHRKKICA